MNIPAIPSSIGNIARGVRVHRARKQELHEGAGQLNGRHRGTRRRLNTVVHAKKVRGIVLALERKQAIVVRAVREHRPSGT